MHPRVSEIVDLLARQRAALLDAVTAIPPDRRDDRPAPDVWSVGELLEHLHKVEAGSARLLARRLESARAAGLPAETETDSVLGTLDAAAFIESPPRVAPELVRPSDRIGTAEALVKLEHSRAALLDVLRDGDGLALGRVTANHAALGEITLYQWAMFIALHEARHTHQLRRIAAAFGGEPPAPATAVGPHAG